MCSQQFLCVCVCCRFTGSVELHNQSHGSSAPHCPAGPLRHHHLCHHRPGALHGQDAQDLRSWANRYTHAYTPETEGHRERIYRRLRTDAQIQMQTCMVTHTLSYHTWMVKCDLKRILNCVWKHASDSIYSHFNPRDGHTGANVTPQTFQTNTNTTHQLDTTYMPSQQRENNLGGNWNNSCHKWWKPFSVKVPMYTWT